MLCMHHMVRRVLAAHARSVTAALVLLLCRPLWSLQVGAAFQAIRRGHGGPCPAVVIPSHTKDRLMSSHSSAQTAQTLEHHLQSFYVGDVEAIMADFAADAVLITPDGTLYGPAQIRPVFETFVTQIMPPGSTLTILKQSIEGEIAYLLWTGESAQYRIPWGTDTFVVRAGKIVAQTFAAQMDAKNPAARE